MSRQCLKHRAKKQIRFFAKNDAPKGYRARTPLPLKREAPGRSMGDEPMGTQRDRLLNHLLVSLMEMKARVEAQQIAMEVLVHTMCSEGGLSSSLVLTNLETARSELAGGLGKSSDLAEAFLDVRNHLQHLLAGPSKLEVN